MLFLFDIRRNCYTFAILFSGEMSDAKGTPLEMVERARLVRRTPLEKVCIPLKGIEDSNKNKLYYSYILKSLKDSKYYYGSTEDVNKRLLKHNSGQVPSTKYRRPFIIHFVEEHASRSFAFQRERFYKSKEGYRYLKEKNII